VTDVGHLDDAPDLRPVVRELLRTPASSQLVEPLLERAGQPQGIDEDRRVKVAAGQVVDDIRQV